MSRRPYAKSIRSEMARMTPRERMLIRATYRALRSLDDTKFNARTAIFIVLVRMTTVGVPA